MSKLRGSESKEESNRHQPQHQQELASDLQEEAEEDPRRTRHRGTPIHRQLTPEALT